jgi:anti-sigma-K factor RskA
MDPSPHLNDDQLIARLYATDAAGDAHLELCPECARRWQALAEGRARYLEELPRSAIHWSEQRRQILERLDQGGESPAFFRRAWATALFAVLVLAAGAWFYRPAGPPPPKAAVATLEDTGSEWYEETYSAMQPDEPRAASPIRVLFEPQEERVTE